jgi:hypothetical protein
MVAAARAARVGAALTRESSRRREVLSFSHHHDDDVRCRLEAVERDLERVLAYYLAEAAA